MARKVTKQGIFNFIIKFIVHQGDLAYSKDSCEYRTEKDGNTMACAAGCLLTDKEAARFPQGNWIDLRDLHPERFKSFEAFINECQGAHDDGVIGNNSATPKYRVGAFLNKMEEVGKRHGLDLSVLISQRNLLNSK